GQSGHLGVEDRGLLLLGDRVAIGRGVHAPTLGAEPVRQPSVARQFSAAIASAASCTTESDADAAGVNPSRTTTSSSEGITSMSCPSWPLAEYASEGNEGQRSEPSGSTFVRQPMP